jgi:hypothetical protein
MKERELSHSAKFYLPKKKFHGSSGFNSRPVHVGFVVNEVALEKLTALLNDS